MYMHVLALAVCSRSRLYTHMYIDTLVLHTRMYMCVCMCVCVGVRARACVYAGVEKAALVQHLSAASKALLLGDRYFPDAFVPSSLVCCLCVCACVCSVCLSVCRSLCLSVCLSICLSVDLSIHLCTHTHTHTQLQFATLLQTPEGRSKDGHAGARAQGHAATGSLVAPGDEEPANGLIWSLDRVRLLAKTRCGISSPSLLHHALDLVHATGHALVLPCSFAMPCAQGQDTLGGRRASGRSEDARSEGRSEDECHELPASGHASSFAETDESGESGRWEVGPGGRPDVEISAAGGAGSGVVVLSSTSIGWISQSSALVVSLSHLVASLPPPSSSPHAHEPELASTHGAATWSPNAAHLSAWSLLIAALRPVLGLHVPRADSAPQASSWVRSAVPWKRAEAAARPSAADVRARQMVEELELCDADAQALRRGLLLPAVARILLSRPACPHWCVTAQILVRCVYVCVCVCVYVCVCVVCIHICETRGYVYVHGYMRVWTHTCRHAWDSLCYRRAQLPSQEAAQAGSGWVPRTCPYSAAMWHPPRAPGALCLPAGPARWCRRWLWKGAGVLGRSHCSQGGAAQVGQRGNGVVAKARRSCCSLCSWSCAVCLVPSRSLVRAVARRLPPQVPTVLRRRTFGVKSQTSLAAGCPADQAATATMVTPGRGGAGD